MQNVTAQNSIDSVGYIENILPEITAGMELVQLYSSSRCGRMPAFSALLQLCDL